MSKGIKYALVFTGGVAVGVGVCGANLISYALSNEDIREGFKNNISRKIDKPLYGDEPNRRRYSNVSCRAYKNGKISYRSYYDDKRDDRRDGQHTYSSRFNYDDLLFDSRHECEAVREQMLDVIETYGFVTVADMYDMADLSAPYTSSKYGWTNLNSAEIVRVRNGYKINLQSPVLINTYINRRI